jgi:DNA-binding response OmpR family regulator
MAYNILVVDDDKFMLAICRVHLSLARFKVLEASDGKQAMDVVMKSNPAVDLMITDFHMPNMNGLVLANNLRKLKYAFPIILTSSDTDILLKFAQHSEHKVFDDILPKPIAAKDMIDKINNLLQKSDTLKTVNKSGLAK